MLKKVIIVGTDLAEENHLEENRTSNNVAEIRQCLGSGTHPLY
jgi:hypothetical protein